MHKGLENFTRAHPKELPKDAAGRLVACFEVALKDFNYPEYDVAKERARLEKIAAQIVTWMTDRRQRGWEMRGVEVGAKLYLKDYDFTLTGYADMIEKGPLGYAVTDYKTGVPSSVKIVKAGFDPQLPLSAAMLQQGAFDKQTVGEVEELNYIRLKGAGDDKLEYPLTHTDRQAQPAPDYAVEAIQALGQLIETYDQIETSYPSQPRAQYTHDYGDYDHLARRDEWMRLGAEPSTGDG